MPLRIEYDGAFYHITARGNERNPIYREEGDYQRFLGILSDLPQRYGILIHGYVYKENTILIIENKKILSDVAKLSAILPQIDKENFEWLKLSASYVNEDFNSSFFIEYLDELKDKGDNKEIAKYISEIFLRMLEKFTPDYDQKHIRSIMEFLYNSQAEENASKICNIYGSRGYELLRDIYEKYSNKP